MSCPPAAMPSITRGRRSARPAYTAAVSPEGPAPMMMTSRTSGIRVLRAGGSDRPAERAGDHEDSAEDQIREPDVTDEHDEHPEQRDGEQHHRDEHEEADEQAGDDRSRRLLGRNDRLVAD